MALLDQTLAAIETPCSETAAATQRELDAKTKPLGSLGRLEGLACRVAAIQQTREPCVDRKALVVLAADHGIAREGVSAYPQEVTQQMLLNFAKGGAAINVLAAQAGADLVVADFGVCKDGSVPELDAEGCMQKIRNCRLGQGTASFLDGPAMSREVAINGIEKGIGIASDLAASGVRLVGIGEMGIGNTTSASALTSVLLRLAPDLSLGRGTGVDDEGLARKLDAITRGIEANAPDATDALDCLSKLGGFEIAGMVGVYLGSAAHRIPVLIDGFISAVAALLAAQLSPALSGYLLPSHVSVEPGHRHVLDTLGLAPLFDLELRLGEGSGSALAMPIVHSAVQILRDMATFKGAGVSERPQDEVS